MGIRPKASSSSELGVAPESHGPGHADSADAIIGRLERFRDVERLMLLLRPRASRPATASVDRDETEDQEIAT